MINDIDTQKISQIERRIGVHEHKVSALEQRWMAFNEWWIQQPAQAPGIVQEQTQTEDADEYEWNQMIASILEDEYK
jgi:hypothetical protein